MLHVMHTKHIDTQEPTQPTCACHSMEFFVWLFCWLLLLSLPTPLQNSIHLLVDVIWWTFRRPIFKVIKPRQRWQSKDNDRINNIQLWTYAWSCVSDTFYVDFIFRRYITKGSVMDSMYSHETHSHGIFHKGGWLDVDGTRVHT